MMKNRLTIREYVRAVRLPFITVSIFPFILGSFLYRGDINILTFILGLISVIFTHLGANVFNDYSDSKSGADWIDKKFYGFFGGSKLLQEGICSESFYLKLAVSCLVLAAICIFMLAAILKTFIIIGLYFIILLLGLAYSHKPFRFSYYWLGEVIIFILFGPAIVMGGYFIQTGIFPALESFMLSLPFGFFTVAILFANEVPDFPEDIKAGKYNWVSLVGVRNAFALYYFIIISGILCVALNVALKHLSVFSLCSFIFIFLAVKAANILKIYYGDKTKLVESSKLTIGFHTVMSIGLILDVIL